VCGQLTYASKSHSPFYPWPLDLSRGRDGVSTRPSSRVLVPLVYAGDVEAFRHRYLAIGASHGIPMFALRKAPSILANNTSVHGLTTHSFQFLARIANVAKASPPNAFVQSRLDACLSRAFPNLSSQVQKFGKDRTRRYWDHKSFHRHQSVERNNVYSSNHFPNHEASVQTMAQAFKETQCPPVRPYSPAPLAEDFARQQVSKQQRSNFHSSSLRRFNSNMVSNSVNKTALHPSGVE
jgi:hypothetical protein